MLPLYQIAGVDLIDKALSQFDPLNLASILPKLKKIKQTDLGFTVWSDYEIEDFIEVVAHHGNDIEAIVGELKTKSIADVVRRYYMVVGLVDRTGFFSASTDST